VATLKSCPSCRALIDASESTCPYCGASTEKRAVREVPLGASENSGLVTGWLIGACILFFILEMMATLGALGPKGLWMALMNVPGPILFEMGARATPRILAGEWWRLIVPIFLHGNVLHILFNTMALIQAGPLAEQAYGRSRFLVIFLVSGALGFLLGTYTSPGSISIGASGSLFGLIGAAGLYGHRRGDAFGRMIRGTMIQWALYAFLFGLLIRADNAAHLGGLASGIALAFVMGDRHGRGDDRIWGAVAAVCVAVSLTAIGLGIAGYLGNGAR
jgi:rhomboid protease GluP